MRDVAPQMEHFRTRTWGVKIVIPHSPSTGDRRHMRRELLHQYLKLQKELIDGDPASSGYQATIHAFRQMGYTLISSGFEEDLDRLLRLRVLEGGRAIPLPQARRSPPSELHVLEERFSQ